MDFWHWILPACRTSVRRISFFNCSQWPMNSFWAGPWGYIIEGVRRKRVGTFCFRETGFIGLSSRGVLYRRKWGIWRTKQSSNWIGRDVTNAGSWDGVDNPWGRLVNGSPPGSSRWFSGWIRKMGDWEVLVNGWVVESTKFWDELSEVKWLQDVRCLLRHGPRLEIFLGGGLRLRGVMLWSVAAHVFELIKPGIWYHTWQPKLVLPHPTQLFSFLLKLLLCVPFIWTQYV